MPGRPPRPASFPAGYDEEDPYEDEDLSTYPDWWRHNIEEFRSHGLRPYKPSRFIDDEIVPRRIRRLEDELDVEIRFRTVTPGGDDRWQLVVNEAPVAVVNRRREGEGFSRYLITAEAFDTLVRTASEG